MIQSPNQPRGLARAAMERENQQLRSSGVRIPIVLRPSLDGNTQLVHGETGEVISPCASQEIAERTKEFFA